MSIDFLVGLDLGQSHDPTALSVLEKVGSKPAPYHVRQLLRFPLGTTYPAIVNRVTAAMEGEALAGRSCLVVDATGVGAPVVDLFKEAGLEPIAITITGGSNVSHEGRAYNVPKRDLVVNLQVLFQAGRLLVAKELPDAQTFIQELLAFKVRISQAGHDSYGGAPDWREGVHDDLVLSVAMAAWYAEKIPEIVIYPMDLGSFRRVSPWRD